MDRLQRMLYLSTVIAKRAKKCESEGMQFDIMNEKQWELARFDDIAQETIMRLMDPKKLKLFIDTFKNGYKEQLTYYEFF